MRSSLALLVPAALLSFQLVACAEDEEQPSSATTQSGLVTAGGACERSEDCASGLACEVTTLRSIGVRGEPMMDPCDADPEAKGCAIPAQRGRPTASEPTTTTTAPTGAPAVPTTDEPITRRVCTAH